MKLLTSLTAIAVFSTLSFTADAGQRGKLIIDNDSKDAIAAGGDLIAEQGQTDGLSGSGSLLYFSGKRAHAGSVIVNGCPCRKKTVVKNKSRNAMAIGAASAGSVVLNSGYQY
ncbi:hypothetical protein [Kangiella sp. HZ709]|uniref:hypothetical protein n=1 Tax=Kangiella sp. HZ709 TaxID=2666328 RepID=UPI0012AEFE2A|nr:hypothetical protein [Kangiella sp. HZ709]MRX28646.1 hypothetical protein [Kangiella sp. HZ709]